MRKIVVKLFVPNEAKGETIAIGWLIIFGIALIGSYIAVH